VDVAKQVHDFVVESNRIEGIDRPPTTDELEATNNFIHLEAVILADVAALAKTYAGVRADLRSERGMDVVVGSHRPPKGGSKIEPRLRDILQHANRTDSDPYLVHHDFETLHPFVDGNGRTGRALWAWMMVYHGIHPELQLGFLHCWYYQSLSARRG